MTHDELVNMVMEKHRNNPLQAASLIIVLGMPESEVTAYFEKVKSDHRWAKRVGRWQSIHSS
jgi:hypothetical protein